MLFTIGGDKVLHIKTKPTIWFSTFRRYLIAQIMRRGGGGRFFNPFERSVLCHFFNLEREFASIPGSTQEKHKGTS